MTQSNEVRMFEVAVPNLGHVRFIVIGLDCGKALAHWAEQGGLDCKLWREYEGIHESEGREIKQAFGAIIRRSGRAYADLFHM